MQVSKKVDETRKRAGQIIEKKKRNQENLDQKLMRNEQIRMEEAMKREMNLRNKEERSN